MRGSVILSFAFLFAICGQVAGQDIVSASSGVLQYFEGAVILDDHPIEHKAAAFPSMKDGSILRTEKGRAELLLTPGVYLRMDENTSIRMKSNSLTDTRLEVTSGSVILDNLNATSKDPVVMSYQESEVRFPKPGIYRLDCDLGELQAYRGEAQVAHHGSTTTVDTSQLYYFQLEIATTKFGDGAMDEFYDWAHNRSEVIADQNQEASAQQDDSEDPDPNLNGMFVVPPPTTSPGYTPMPSLPGYGYSAYGGGIDSFYLYSPAQYLGYPAFSNIFVLYPSGYRSGSRYGYGYTPGIGSWPRTPVMTRWPSSITGIGSHLPVTASHYPLGTGISHVGTSMPRTTYTPVAPHVSTVHPAIGRR